MNVICLGGAGRICREAALDLVLHSDFDRITIADVSEKVGLEVASWLGNHRVDFVKLDIHDRSNAVNILKAYDIVLDGTTISLNRATTGLIAEAGCHGLNLNGFGEEYQFSDTFKAKGKLFVPGFGMTPGTTNMMAKQACDAMESVESVRVSHGAFRPIAFSPSITETTTYEYDPDLPGRVVFENGHFVQVKPFARPRVITLPRPYPALTQYIIPHSETVTLAEYLKDKGVRLIEVRGSWPEKNMQLVRALYDWGFMKNERVSVKGAQFGIMEAVSAYLMNSEHGRTTDLYGYALHVEVVGMQGGRRIRHTLTHTHPASDGSVPGWEGLRAYTRNVAIPFAVGAVLMAKGKASGTGALIPEKVFEPEDVFEELAKRQILIHSEVEEAAAPGDHP